MRDEHAQRLDASERMYDFVAQAAAELAERFLGRVIRERADRYRVAADERGAQGRARAWSGGLAAAERRRISALGKVDDDLVVVTLVTVVANEPRAQAAGLYPDDGVGARVEGRFLAEDLHADHVFLEIAAASRRRFEDDEAQKAAKAIDLRERRAPEDAIELLPDGLLGQPRRRRNRAPCRHRPTIIPKPGASRQTARGESLTPWQPCPYIRRMRSV